MNTNFLIDEPLLPCVNFACHAFKKSTQVKTNFGTEERTPIKYITDMVEGKIAEFTVEAFLKQLDHDITLHVDMEHYDDIFETDQGNDLQKLNVGGLDYQCSLTVDVKGTKSFSKWLLVEHSKWNRYSSAVYIMVAVDLPNLSYAANQYGNSFNWEITKSNPLYIPIHINKLQEQLKREWIGKIASTKILGFVFREDFFVPGTDVPLFLYEQGDRLVSPYFFRTYKNNLSLKVAHDLLRLKKIPKCLMGKEDDTLKAYRNYGFPIEWLRSSENEWYDLINLIKNSTH